MLISSVIKGDLAWCQIGSSFDQIFSESLYIEETKPNPFINNDSKNVHFLHDESGQISGSINSRLSISKGISAEVWKFFFDLSEPHIWGSLSL
jgi:hypothetical protein